jgi:hypothetical protein
MPAPSPIAVLFSDLHLTLLQPACRADKDWMGVQAGYLAQVKELAEDLPVICAGDIFDRWNPPPELINFALEHLPDAMICVPGQHDLPNHRMDLMHRSGYGVLKKAEKIIDIGDGGWHELDNAVNVNGFGWERDIVPPYSAFEGRKGSLNIAVIHRYFWYEDKKFPGALPSANVSAFKKELKGYDVAVVGDNHMGFLATAGDCTVLNCGNFIRRKTDEMDYIPSVGVLFSDGTVKRKRLDTSSDVFHEVSKDKDEAPFNMKDFVAGLEGLGEHGMDFKEAVLEYLKANEVHPKTKEIIIQAIETK